MRHDTWQPMRDSAKCWPTSCCNDTSSSRLASLTSWGICRRQKNWTCTALALMWLEGSKHIRVTSFMSVGGTSMMSADLILVLSCRCAIFFWICEGPHTLKWKFFAKLHQLLMAFFCLTCSHRSQQVKCTEPDYGLPNRLTDASYVHQEKWLMHRSDV